MKRTILTMSGALLLTFTCVAAHGSDSFMKPTPEELSMTSLPGYPGAAAVVLFREQITEDNLHVVNHYERIKILTEDGKKYANIELGFVSTTDDSDYGSNGKTLSEIEGRTIHADGTIIPFTGKPYLKVIEKERGIKFQQKIFTLPDVEVGSIIEYRYATRIGDNNFESPDWLIQGELYVKAAHYVWHPTTKELVDSKERPINSISWFPILPPGVQLVHTQLPASSSFDGAPQTYEVTVKDVPPTVKEEFMPPIASFSYRVMFNFTAYRTGADFWKEEGKDWSKRMDSFANPNGELKAATQTIVAGATTDDEKLKKIYAVVMTLENTRFTREREQREDKADGGSKVKSAADVLTHKRGTATQLTELFVGMARAAGFKAYMMYVPDRSIEIFTPQWLNFSQFDDLIAIVNVGGKEVFFDPGWRYTAYGQLAWEHTFISGLRQIDGGTGFATTPGADYKVNRTTRVANLTMNEKGEVEGKVDLTFMGNAALGWRHTALNGDEESLKRELRESLEAKIPKTLEVTLGQIEGLTDYENPLIVHYDVKGTLGTSTGKRLVLPADFFLAGSKATFPDEKRQESVYFQYSRITQDALRLKLPSNFTVEATPDNAKFNLTGEEAYGLNVSSDASSFTTRRDHIQSEILVPQPQYEALRKFYVQFEAKDQESVVLKVAPVTAASN
jgi:hypothetical protein